MTFDVDRIVQTPLDLSMAVHRVSGRDAGAVATFLGVVRDHNEGRPVTLLEYEAYGRMAQQELLRVEEEVVRAIPQVRVFAMHRVGALQVGDAAVVCVASSPHREEAFRAVRLLIDEIKARLPIWKREHGPDGPYWVGWQDARCFGQEHHNHDRHEGRPPANKEER